MNQIKQCALKTNIRFNISAICSNIHYLTLQYNSMSNRVMHTMQKGYVCLLYKIYIGTVNFRKTQQYKLGVEPTPPQRHSVQPCKKNRETETNTNKLCHYRTLIISTFTDLFRVKTFKSFCNAANITTQFAIKCTVYNYTPFR